MPQMSPLSWTMLFLYFIMMLIIFCLMNYYIFLYKSPKSLIMKKKTQPSLIWKW
uniref:ATP synthase complex subunit 8 n=1 Tax=Nymphes myrmeleonoides TaxID=560922 RepID=A0A088CB24_NYMMY|nr:ATP synthase F0 subunit 8 [Nymphes myrmeleonoides]AHY39214.1 ATP synthase F0 subunit 8 [Nymphes myrmeleonoides]